MGLCLGKATSGPWRDLPPEISGEILSRLLSDDDCISYGAVCREWRLATRHQWLAVPWINLGNGTYQSIANGTVRHFPTPKWYRARTSFDNWVMYQHKGSGRCLLRAHFSASTQAIKVPSRYLERMACSVNDKYWAAHGKRARRTQPMDIDTYRGMKMVVCSSRLVVMRLHGYQFGMTAPNFRLAKYTNMLCFVPNQRRPTAWLPVISPYHHRPSEGSMDIAFYRGKTFALTLSGKLFCHDLFADVLDSYRERQAPLVDHVVEDRPALSFNSYLVVSSDKQKLLMVHWSRSITEDNGTTMDLRVFEADFSEGRWSELKKDLGGQVLFLSRNCSKALAAGSVKHYDHRFQRGNCVFVLGKEWARTWTRPAIFGNDTPSYCVYDMVSGETELVSLDGARNMSRSMSGWFFPSE
ncbi:hypothetical protein QYE76_017209 [Lolium multiflorum]|uniref:F-box domain-containing protein n=1 Tax=Lolium multiflorum TaxID=4521 RepID=A0AAD8UVH5_LOLMU|nr:hypothetical protein QYE76_017209 [Lolium multiflorum]